MTNYSLTEGWWIGKLWSWDEWKPDLPTIGGKVQSSQSECGVISHAQFHQVNVIKIWHIKCTHFKCIVQWALTNVYTCVTTTPTMFTTLSITPEMSLIHLCSQFPYHTGPGICVWSNFYHYRLPLPVLELHIRGIVRYAVCHVWLPSLGIILRFICVLCVSVVCSILLLRSILVWKYYSL